MASFLRYLSVVLLIALLLVTALVLVLDTSGESLSTRTVGAIAILVVIGAVLPILVLLLLWSRSELELRRVAAVVRHLTAGETKKGRMLADLPGESSRALRELADEIDRRRTAAEEEKRSLWQVMDAMGEGIVAIDGDRKIVLLNEAVSRIFGTPRAVEGRPFIEIVRNQTLAAAFDRALQGTNVSQRAIVAAGTEQRQIEMRVFPVTSSGQIAAVALLIDQTEIHRLQRIRRDFIADFSHEVRTPLAGLRAAVESLEGGVQQREQADQLYRIVSRQLQRLERLVGDLSQLNEIESGEAVLEKERVDLLRVLSDVRDDYAESAATEGVVINLRGEPVQVEIDVLRIQQVLSNLIDNALRHSGSSDTIELTLERYGHEVIVRVRDFGAGIPEHEQTRIFHRFYRVEKSRSASRGEGTGLGLAIAKHLVLRHGGRIGVESAPGAGACFWISLPLIEEPAPAR